MKKNEVMHIKQLAQHPVHNLMLIISCVIPGQTLC